jgi:hypothetical protein
MKYILYNDIKYGITSIHNFIHRDNNCFGKIIKDYWQSYRCNRCESWNYSDHSGTQYYKCSKYDYKYNE